MLQLMMMENTHPDRLMSRYSILVVDDEENIVNIIRTILTNEGYEVSGASCFQEAIAIIAAETVHLLISDQGMPGRTGLELIGEVREKFPGVITILMTGHSKVDFPLEVIENAGIFSMIEKPFSKRDIIDTVRRALTKKD